MARKKVIERLELNSREEVDAALKTIAVNSSKIQERQAVYNADEHERRQALNVELAPLQNEKEHLETQIRLYCEQNRDEFGKKKSLELTHGTLSFRLGTKKVKAIRKFTLKSALETILGLPQATFGRYVRIKEELNREAIIEDETAGLLEEEQLKTMGLQVVQEETFGYDLKDVAVSPK